jgi:hypothetical protein
MTHMILQLNINSMEKSPRETCSSSAGHEISCLMEPNNSLPCPQKPAIGSCPQTRRIQSTPLHSIYWSIPTSTEPSPSWEVTGRSAAQVFPPNNLWNPKVHNSPPLAPILTQMSFLFISSWIKFWSATAVPKYMNSATFNNFNIIHQSMPVSLQNFGVKCMHFLTPCA